MLLALRRELVTCDRLVVRIVEDSSEVGSRIVIVIADPEKIDAVATAEVGALSQFNEWRGGCGLSLAVARRVIGQHGGTLYGPASAEDKASAVIVLPRS